MYKKTQTTNRVSEEERRLFRQAVEGFSVKTTLKPSKKVQDNDFSLPAFYLSDYAIDNLKPEESVFYLAKGSSLEPTVLKQIERGEYPIDQRIDLHGDTIEFARNKLIHTMKKAQENQWRLLLIIHGKGHHAKLKNHVVHWLKQMTGILFFCSAQPKNGGTGALYVFLKRAPKLSQSPANLDFIRKNIDCIDYRLVDLLCQRFDYAKQAAVLKQTSIRDDKREEAVLDRVGKQAEKKGLDKKNIFPVFKEILDQMRRYQKSSLVVSTKNFMGD
jgi:DNA-nicking Smr family endonuclease/chorismate mutase